jgi:acyl-CoA reductase-like NAD-dependent aldehyde dehydrogenase
MPPGVVTLVPGEAETAQSLMRDPAITAVSITGSQRAGQDAASLCALFGKPLQAELGGNNALIVLADADIEGAAPALARSAFSFAGQRCTAVRRFIVEASVAAKFERVLASATRALRVGDPRREDTDVGPLISPERRAQVAASVEWALAGGGRLVIGGGRPEGQSGACWFEPTLLADIEPEAAIAQQETFGPVALIQRAADLDDALRLANGVPQGLLAGLLSANAAAQVRFAAGIDAGILQFGAGPFALHADAPFGGWKSSRIGPAEHGRWDREFYARPQVLYGEADAP